MYQGELRKYDPDELSAYFKGADRLYYWIRDDLREFSKDKKRISIDKLLQLMDYLYLNWYSGQINYGLEEEEENEE